MFTFAMSMQAQKNVKFEFQTSEARTLDLYPSTYIHPLIAEVVVDTKTGRIHDSWNLSYEDYKAREDPNSSQATLQNLRAYALFKSSEKHNCDIIVAATFDIKITDQGTTINIVGYPANFTNWSTGVKADYDWILLERQVQHIDFINNNDKEKDSNKKK